MKFETGSIYTTKTIHEDMHEGREFHHEVMKALGKYTSGDWGDCCEEDRQANDYAAENGERILAAYETSKGTIWIITEWDRSATTILYPDEY
jgi:hypothetical protein